MSAQLENDEWMMGGSKDPALQERYGLSEAEIAAVAVDAAYYAMEKAGVSRPIFLYELVGELSVQLAQHLGVELPED